MKKILLICLMLLACVLIFTACGSETITTTETPATTTAPTTTTALATTEVPVTTEAPTTTKTTGATEVVVSTTVPDTTTPNSTTAPVTTEVPTVTLAPGLYDDNDKLVASWEELVTVHNMKVDKDYSRDTYDHYGIGGTSPYYVLTYAFELQTGTKLVLGNVDRIGNYAFAFCANLTSITIPNSVTSIGDDAFRACYSLASITIPDGVTSIGDYAFYGCTKLTSIRIPGGVTLIGNYAFLSCTSLTKFLVDQNNPNYSSDGIALYNKDKTKLIQVPASVTSFTIPRSVTSIGDYAFYYCIKLESITIPSSVTSIGCSAFESCAKLESITIPDSVTWIGECAFVSCVKLKSILVDQNNPNYSSDGIALYNKDKTKLIQVPASVTSFTIPGSITSIGDYAFYDCSNLTRITIPDGVTSIGDRAFLYCRNLTAIYCEATSQPGGWNSDWNYACDAKVHWGVGGSKEEPPVDEPPLDENIPPVEKEFMELMADAWWQQVYRKNPIVCTVNEDGSETYTWFVTVRAADGLFPMYESENGTSLPSIQLSTAEGAFVYIKDVNKDEDYTKYTVSGWKTENNYDISFVVDGFVPEDGAKYDMALFFVMPEHSAHPGDLVCVWDLGKTWTYEASSINEG